MRTKFSPIYGLEDVTPSRQQELLKDIKAIIEEGEKIWLPEPDILVAKTAIEVEVWGRCPQ